MTDKKLDVEELAAIVEILVDGPNAGMGFVDTWGRWDCDHCGVRIDETDKADEEYRDPKGFSRLTGVVHDDDCLIVRGRRALGLDIVQHASDPDNS